MLGRRVGKLDPRHGEAPVKPMMWYQSPVRQDSERERLPTGEGSSMTGRKGSSVTLREYAVVSWLGAMTILLVFCLIR